MPEGRTTLKVKARDIQIRANMIESMVSKLQPSFENEQAVQVWEDCMDACSAQFQALQELRGMLRD